MRIISGSFRGKRITAPSNLPVRPTTDFAKEALFNLLNNRFDIDEISVLDLFSGIGSITLEFASRGSQKIVSVDLEPKCVKFLSETVISLKMEQQVNVIKNDAFQFLKRNSLGAFDVIFADPPYTFVQSEYDMLINLVKDNEWLNVDGELVLEHSSQIKFDENEFLLETRKYGNVQFSFFSF